MHRNGVLFFVLFMIISAYNAKSQEVNPYKADYSYPPTIPGYVLSWHDEFDVDGKPDPRNWKYEKGFVRNKELQWYQSANANCRNGLLVIEGRRESVLNTNYKAHSKDWRVNRKYAEYTSACIKTKGLQQFHYGRIEVRARIDTLMGAWPAIWTLGIKNSWPLNGEVDIMEFYRFKEKPIILANAAWGKNESGGPVWNTRRYALSHFTSKDPEWTKKFHLWRMDWNKDAINLYLDGELMNAILFNKTINPDGSNPFLNPQYLLLNLAIGAAGGDPSNTKFPIRYEVDYVRYYKKKQS